MKFSFIIVNYKSADYLSRCIHSIKSKVNGFDCEVIVINNDPEAKDLETSLPNGVNVANTGKNLGFGAANNIGAKEAKGEILCFLNPDTEITSDNMEDLLKEFKENVGIVGPRLISESEKTQEWIAGKEVTIWSVILNNLGYKKDKKIWESKIPVECAWVSGAAMFIRKDLFEKLSGFDERFFMYFEDIDLCKRARQAEYKVLYYPNFQIKHFGGKSFLDKKEQKRYYYKSQWRYFKKYFYKSKNHKIMGGGNYAN